MAAFRQDLLVPTSAREVVPRVTALEAHGQAVILVRQKHAQVHGNRGARRTVAVFMERKLSIRPVETNRKVDHPPYGSAGVTTS